MLLLKEGKHLSMLVSCVLLMGSLSAATRAQKQDKIKDHILTIFFLGSRGALYKWEGEGLPAIRVSLL